MRHAESGLTGVLTLVLLWPCLRVASVCASEEVCVMPPKEGTVCRELGQTHSHRRPECREKGAGSTTLEGDLSIFSDMQAMNDQ